jgi:hypothetical protein
LRYLAITDFSVPGANQGFCINASIVGSLMLVFSVD